MLKRSRSRKLNRLPEYDYSQEGYYFVTICTKNGHKHFGKVVNKKAILTEIGEIAYAHWREIPKHYDNVILDQFVIMPNHVHGIIIIESNESNVCDGNVVVGTEHCSVPTNNGSKKNNSVGRNYGLLSRIIKSYKEAVTKNVRRNTKYSGFSWQRSFYDHVVRNDVALSEIRKYILLNPAKWEIDENNKDTISTENPDSYTGHFLRQELGME